MTSDTDGNADGAIDFAALAHRIATTRSRGPVSRLRTSTPAATEFDLSEMIAEIASRRDAEPADEPVGEAEPETVAIDMAADDYDDWPEPEPEPSEHGLEEDGPTEGDIEPAEATEASSEPTRLDPDPGAMDSFWNNDQPADVAPDANDDDSSEPASTAETNVLGDEPSAHRFTTERATSADDDGVSEGLDDLAEDADIEEDPGTLVLTTDAAPEANGARSDARSGAVTPIDAATDDRTEDTSARRRPRIALMGEFSAGKSTLSNLLIGARSLPVNVTATQLPPVWISKGDRRPFRVDLDGNEHAVDLNRLEEIEVEETSHIRIFRDADLLEECDLIDMPGISDPNMSAEVWQRLLPQADGIIWCTHATQAWRQSEAAVWAQVPAELQARSLLLLTRMDKILTDRDRDRVMKRVGRETEGLFAGQFGISLTQALEAEEGSEAWTASGGEDFSEALLELIRLLETELGDAPDLPTATASASTSLTKRPSPVDIAPIERTGDLPPDVRVMPARIRPRSMRNQGAPRIERPGGRDLRL